MLQSPVKPEMKRPRSSTASAFHDAEYLPARKGILELADIKTM